MSFQSDLIVWNDLKWINLIRSIIHYVIFIPNLCFSELSLSYFPLRETTNTFCMINDDVEIYQTEYWWKSSSNIVTGASVVVCHWTCYHCKSVTKSRHWCVSFAPAAKWWKFSYGNDKVENSWVSEFSKPPRTFTWSTRWSDMKTACCYLKGLKVEILVEGVKQRNISKF